MPELHYFWEAPTNADGAQLGSQDSATVPFAGLFQWAAFALQFQSGLEGRSLDRHGSLQLLSHFMSAGPHP